MSEYIVSITLVGLAALSMAWVPSLLKRTFLSYPIVYLLIGVGAYMLPVELPHPDPLWQEDYVVHLTELSVIISLMGTGLKLRRKVNWQNWRVPLRLVSITMLLCIGGVALLGWGWLGMAPAAAILLGAVLAPTDPVLAEQVQVGPPNEKEEDDVRFSLTAEAGLNDGTAFPFTWLAVIVAIASEATDSEWITDWVLRDLLYRIVAGVGVGFLVGRGLAYLIFQVSQKTRFPKAQDGFLALSVTLVSYGLTELVHGYGFIAVFVTAITLSSCEPEDEYHVEMHDFINQVEHILMVMLLLLFGGSLVYGLLNYLTWQGIAVGLIFLFIIRPLAALIGMWGVKMPLREKMAVSFFGIRGIGSFFYLSFALDKVDLVEANQLWSVVGFIVMVSIILHGITATKSMSYLDYVRSRSGKKQVPGVVKKG
ncbi:sodium/proton antiporter (CPA1 family) [Pontibacter ummariensis]|uniref:Sodium/proton antiporter, CPA1 family n=1 Tax=Pontibacter ummariensis TaxID=1610492 RepID=A0A239GYL1_9BACT|nr:sodium:proton antiporter [Pontibacter ummariensis]PRY10985.1 sodium/proton antiporter (CPA1 family) [Pontibacter ummariensis]SNS73643.1 sodium/proton antiporter, CPA1 family [Pontibacter ummariensis]